MQHYFKVCRILRLAGVVCNYKRRQPGMCVYTYIRTFLHLHDYEHPYLKIQSQSTIEFFRMRTYQSLKIHYKILTGTRY